MNQSYGFTFIELMVVLVILAISLSFGVGFNQLFLEKNSVDRLEKQVINSIHFSRNKTLSSGQNLTLNSRVDPSDWSSGMVLFVDNPTHHYCEKDKLVYSWSWKSTPGLKLVWRGFKSDKYLLFSSSLRHSTVNGQFVIIKSGVEVRHIVLNRLGRVGPVENSTRMAITR